MHSFVLRRRMMHTAWTTLKEIAVQGDKGKVLVESPISQLLNPHAALLALTSKPIFLFLLTNACLFQLS